MITNVSIPRSRWKPTAVAALVASTMLAGVGCGVSGDSASSDAYSAADLRTGAAVSTESLSGTPVVLVSWATWCKECDEELAGLAEFAASDAAEGLEIVAVNLDAAKVEDAIDDKIERHDLDVTLWRDTRNQFKRSFGALGVPTTVILDADGEVAATFPGAIDFEAADVLAALDEVRAS